MAMIAAMLRRFFIVLYVLCTLIALGVLFGAEGLYWWAKLVLGGLPFAVVIAADFIFTGFRK